MKYEYINLDNKNFYYKYYITEQNKIMNFVINGEKQFFEYDNTAILVWADGNKKIIANINATNNYVKHYKYNTFIIYNLKNYEVYIFSVNASIGDVLVAGVK